MQRFGPRQRLSRSRRWWLGCWLACLGVYSWAGAATQDPGGPNDAFFADATGSSPAPNPAPMIAPANPASERALVPPADPAPLPSGDPSARHAGAPVIDAPDQFPPETWTPWLEEVRAQRQAWESRREAARDAFDSRRRASNPRAAAAQEAWEETVQRRRSARLEHMEQERRHFLQLAPSFPPLIMPGEPPWPNDAPVVADPPGVLTPFSTPWGRPWPNDHDILPDSGRLPSPGAPWTRPWTRESPGASPESERLNPFGTPPISEGTLLIPPGWDNLWYFRGY